MFGTTFSKALTLLRFSYAKKYSCTPGRTIKNHFSAGVKKMKKTLPYFYEVTPKS